VIYGVTAMRRPSIAQGLALGVALVLLAAWGIAWLRFPSDRTVEGAYYRVVKAVVHDEPQAFFAYIETEAQHACFTIGEYRAKSKQRVLKSFPPAARPAALHNLEPLASHPDGPEVFASLARSQGWLDNLRRDLSGIDHVEQNDERASAQTIRGTRYPFRRRENGIWGLTLFTAFLMEEAERAARDDKQLEQAAVDYDRKR